LTGISLSITDFRRILQHLFVETGYDFREYAVSTLKFRIERVMKSYNFEAGEELLSFMSGNKTFQESFVSDLQIPGTELFRDPEMWSALRKHVLSKLPTKKPIQVFVPSCVSGEELYTLIIWLNEAELLDNVELTVSILTPKNELVIRQANFNIRKSDQTKKNIELLDTDKTFDDFFNVKQDYFTPKLRLPAQTRFIVSPFVKTDYLNVFDLILFRNKLLNYNDKLHREAMHVLHDSLVKGGHLMLGIGENTGELFKRRFKEVVKGERIFKKNSF